MLEVGRDKEGWCSLTVMGREKEKDAVSGQDEEHTIRKRENEIGKLERENPCNPSPHTSCVQMLPIPGLLVLSLRTNPESVRRGEG